jgi:hypothetical protein
VSATDRETGPGLYRLLAASPIMGAATAYRAGAAYASVWYKKAPRLTSLWFDAVEPGPGAASAGAKLRKEMLAASELSVKRVSHELNRGIHDLEHVSRPPAKRKRPPTIF